MPRTAVLILCVALAGCALQWPTVSVQDSGSAQLPSQRREQRYIKRLDHPKPPPNPRRRIDAPPRRASTTRRSMVLSLLMRVLMGILHGRSGYHDFLGVTLGWPF